MIKNKLKINDTKTEFIVFRSPQAKQDFSSQSVWGIMDSIILGYEPAGLTVHPPPK